MPLSTRLRRHLQSHVVAYLALFVALSGTALALPGKKQVKSDDLANGAVKGKAIAANAVSSSKIRNGSVTAAKLGAASVTAAKLGGAVVGTAALGDGSVTSSKLADDAVIRQKIAQGEINGGKLANGAVNSSKVADGTLSAEDFAAGQISDGFSFSPEPDVTGTPIDQFQTTYTAPRAGRLLITAAADVALNCTGPCDTAIGLYVDDAYVAGSTRTPGDGLSGFTGTVSATTSGLTALSAGPHEIAVKRIGDDSVATLNEQITGILLQ